ncbi:MAG: prepilin-type N-terminal cleavage/methylation domain-containing protein [Candidatus Omnitrophica bacterium]|nr:prepilin-type N-terminal cleavage/methylation domain-containing protein [Candidatus Omnitrophota bacterium]
MKNRKPGFTLIELLIVIVIILILAAIFTPMMSKVKVKSLDKEAISSLKLIAAAEKIYRMEQGFYVPGANEVALNPNLKLLLPTADPNWEYKVDGTTPSAFTAKAKSKSTPANVWCAGKDALGVDYDPTQSGCAW